MKKDFPKSAMAYQTFCFDINVNIVSALFRKFKKAISQL